jgi:hypothetical protein
LVATNTHNDCFTLGCRTDALQFTTFDLAYGIKLAVKVGVTRLNRVAFAVANDASGLLGSGVINDVTFGINKGSLATTTRLVPTSRNSGGGWCAG